MKENPSWFLDQLTLYQAANTSPEAIKRNFLIRIAEFELIISTIRRKKPNDPVQHELILGRRGSGKSTLLRRIQIEIDEDANLAKQYIAINLAEEQASIYRLSDLWFEVLEELMIRFETRIQLRDFDDFEDNQAYTRYLFSEILQLLRSRKKKVVLLLDNLDRILQNFDDDGHLLRETLLNHNDLQIIGASTRMDEHFWQYDKPFYEFFRRHRLEGLRFEEIHDLLNHWSAEMQLPELKDYALRHQGRVEAIRILTDGLPRALQIFIQVLVQDSTLYGFDYLRKVMDGATPLYQERLNNLTAPQRKIVQEMAFHWEAAPTKVLVEKCRMESKLIASFLKQLEQYGIVETIPTGKKNHLYRIAERFFNMWLIVTQGNPDQKRRAKYLTLFLEAWYDEKELKALVQRHLDVLQEGSIPYDKAMVLSKGLAQSRYIGVKERDALIDYTHELCGNRDSGSELPRRFKIIKREIDELWNNNLYEEALRKIEEIENEHDGAKFFMKGYCFHQLKKQKEAEKYYKLAVEKKHISALNNLGNLYQDVQKPDKAKSCYLEAIDKGNVNAINNLGSLYSAQGENTQAEHYFLQAIYHGHIEAIYNLGVLYFKLAKYDQAEHYFLESIAKGNAIAYNNLAILYFRLGLYTKAEEYYLRAIEKGNTSATYNLACLYTILGNSLKAEDYYLEAIKEGHLIALYNLAGLYYETNQKPKESLQYLQQYYAKTLDIRCINNFIILEIWNGKFEHLHQKIESIIKASHTQDIIWLLSNLLYHQQIQLVLSLFESERYGKILKEQYQLIYYATLILANRIDDNLFLRIPPEVLTTIEQIVAQIKTKQAFYSTPVTG